MKLKKRHLTKRYMKKGAFGVFLIVSIGLLMPLSAFTEYKYKPAIGIWFGPTVPLGNTKDPVNGSLGGGLITRGNLPLNNFFYNFDFSWLHFTSDVEKRLDLYPVIGSLMYRLPVHLPVKILLKMGGGTSYVKIQPENKGGWDPVFHAGGEFYFPAGKIVRIGLRTDFLWIMERQIPTAKRDGYVLNIGLTLYFNLVK